MDDVTVLNLILAVCKKHNCSINPDTAVLDGTNRVIDIIGDNEQDLIDCSEELDELLNDYLVED